MNNWSSSILSLLYLAFHIVALVLSAAFWRRCPKACALVMAGGLLNVVAAGVRLVAPMFHLQMFRDQMSFALFYLAIGIVNLLGSALYLTAVFTGRSTARAFPYDDDDDWDRSAPVPKQAEPRSSWFRETDA